MNDRPVRIVRISIHPKFWFISEDKIPILFNILQKKFPDVFIEKTMHPKEFYEVYNVGDELADKVFIEMSNIENELRK